MGLELTVKKPGMLLCYAGLCLCLVRGLVKERVQAIGEILDNGDFAIAGDAQMHLKGPLGIVKKSTDIFSGFWIIKDVCPLWIGKQDVSDHQTKVATRLQVVGLVEKGVQLDIPSGKPDQKAWPAIAALLAETPRTCFLARSAKNRRHRNLRHDWWWGRGNAFGQMHSVLRPQHPHRFGGRKEMALIDDGVA